MPQIVIVIFILFLFIAPKLFKKLLFIHIVTAIMAYFALSLLGGINGATKGGVNEGLYEKESIYLLYYVFSLVGTMLLGIVAGIIVKIFADE